MWRSCRPESAYLAALLLLSALPMGSASTKQFLDLKGARFPAQLQMESSRFGLQGAGILKWGIWFDVYAAAYYLDESNPQNQRLIIHYFVPVKAQQIKLAAEKHLSRQHGAAFLASIKPALDLSLIHI